MPSVRFRVNGVEPRSRPIRTGRCSTFCAGPLRLTGAAFRLRRQPVRRLQRADRRSGRGRMRHAAVGRRGQGRHHRRRARHAGASASAAARFHRRAGHAVRLLHLRHPDLRGRAAENAIPIPARPEVRARSIAICAAAAAHNRIVRAVLRAAARGRRNERQPSSATTGEKLPAKPGSCKPRACRSGCAFAPMGIVEVSPGKVEIGQGILTALAQIAADELDVDLARVRMVPASTAMSPNEGVTSGSLSVEHSGRRCAMPAPRRAPSISPAAAHRLGVAATALDVQDGTSSGPGNLRTSYWELADDDLLERDATREARAEAIAARRRGRQARAAPRHPRQGVRQPRFIHDLALPGMLHGRVLRPPSPGATLIGAGRGGARGLPGVVAVVRDGSFAGVVAETEDGGGGRSSGAAQGRDVDARAKRCPTRRTWRAWIKSQPVETTTDRSSAKAPARTTRPAPCGGSTRAPSSRTPRWRRPAPWPSGPDAACTSGPTARASTTCAPTGARSSAAAR